jgi:two-component system sensor histidine kinase BaeS
MPYIFDPFMQTDEGARRSDAAFRVGLAFAREFVKAHGGSVMVAAPGGKQSSEFAAQLPTEG